LKWNCLLTVHFCFFPFEDGAEREEFSKDAAYGPEINRSSVVASAEEEVGTAVPDCNDYFVTTIERGERLVEAAGKTKVADADGARGGYHDICGFEVAVHYPVLVEVVQAVEELKEYGFNHGCWDGATRWLRVVVYYLEEIVLAVFEDHEDAFVFEDDFD